MYVLHLLGKMVVVLVRKRDSAWGSLTAVGHPARYALSKSSVTASVFTLLAPSPYFSVFCRPATWRHVALAL